MINKVNVIIDSIKNRRTIKPEQCTGEEIPAGHIQKILESANWAPTHGYTEPWRFIVYVGEGKYTLNKAHATLYKAHTPPEKFKQVKYDKLLARAHKTSHIIAIINKRGDNPKVPEIEEIQATAMAVQNMQLVATAMGYAAYINSGGMTYTDSMKAYLNAGSEDKVLGFLYLGVTDIEIPQGRRVTPIEEKVDWVNK